MAKQSEKHDQTTPDQEGQGPDNSAVQQGNGKDRPLGQKRECTERPIESVIEGLQTIQADTVLFSDDNSATNPKWAEQLGDLILANDIRKTFVVQVRIDIAKHPRLLDKAW